MRIRKILEILEENIENLTVEHVTANGKYEIINTQKLTEAVEKISGLGFIDDQYEKINSDLQYAFNDKSPRVFVDQETLNKMRNIVHQIHVMSVAVFNAFTETISKQNELSVSIKLPRFTQLSQVSNFIKDIDTISSQTLTGKFNANIKFQNFDTGSEWIEIIIDNKEAFLFFGQVVKGAFQFLREQYTTLKQAQSVVEMVDVDAEVKRLMIEAIDNNIKAQARLNAKMLMDEFDIDEHDNDYHAKLTYSITKLAELIQKGTEVHTALNAPEETKEAYPDPKQLFIADNRVKLLTDISSDSKEENEEIEDLEE